MSEYELRFAQVCDNQPASLAFLAEDVAAALIIAHGRASDRCAELWRNGTKLCTIKRRPVAGDPYGQIIT